MAWIEDLALTYDNNESEIAKDLDANAILLPIAHSMQNAQIEIYIDKDGKFINAERIAKGNAVTIIPVTEDSATRSSGIAAHPLEDKLEYIAHDYEHYTGINNEEKHLAYKTQLDEWCSSEYSCEEVIAVQRYVYAGKVITDLINKGVLKLENDSLANENIEGIKQEDCFVRFTVYGINNTDIDFNPSLCKNRRLFKKYSDYYLSKLNGTDLCYASGRYVPCSTKHPAKVRHSADKAKLISANDSSGFTYRGRFSDSSQAASIGYEVSQKAHNALRWLIAKQGIRLGEEVIIAWEMAGRKIISIESDTVSALYGEEEESYPTTNEEYAARLKKAIYTDHEDLDTHSNVVVMCVEAATTGRLSVIFYKKITGSDFKKRIQKWHSTCIWRHNYKNFPEGFIGAPSIWDIAVAALDDKNDKQKKAGFEKILPCIIDGRAFPRDMMVAAVERVGKRQSYESDSEFRRMLSVTCAMIRKYHYDKMKNNENKEFCPVDLDLLESDLKYDDSKGDHSENIKMKGEFDMAVDESCTDRSYLYGRLLAAAELLEKRAFKADEKGRDTNAERYMQRFSKKPAETWKIIEEALKPYESKLNFDGKLNPDGSYYWSSYEQEIHEIKGKFTVESFSNNNQLSELYLLGYSHQLIKYNSNKKETKPENEEDK